MMRLSVIVPVFNTPPLLLQEAARSVLEAEGPLVHELILVDDASTRLDTLTMLEALGRQEARVVSVRQPVSGGPARARNAGIERATGDWIGFVDADDMWARGWLARLRRALGEAPDAQWFAGRNVNLGSADELTPDPSFDLEEGVDAAAGHRILSGRALTAKLLANFWFSLGAMVARKDLVDTAGRFEDALYFNEDALFMQRLSRHVALHLLDHDAYVVRRNPGSLTTTVRRLGDDVMAVYNVTARDHRFDDFRRELRWARYAALKGLAVNNLRNGRRGPAMRYALRAWAADPRTVGDLAHFLRLWGAAPSDVRADRIYSKAAPVDLAPITPS